jgi:2-polyprenyl-3-methyl-5-hydroxy-6-metoxy-1,4-benzoquinol methylase
MVDARFDADAGTPDARRALHEQNRLSWNEATRAHNSHKADQARFFREGSSKLSPEEAALLGDLSGKSVVHLQCNSGQDTLSMKRLGAETLLGVDISDEAIGFARQLAADSGIDASFVRADVYDWLARAAEGHERWDVVFCSYGAIIWLSDLSAWARGIAAVLEPGGRVVTVEFHPIEMMFDPEFRHCLPYSTRGRPITWDDGVTDYVAESGPAITLTGWMEGVQGFQNPQPAHEFHWGLSEIVTALLEAGLVLEHFREYDYCHGFRPLREMKDLGQQRWTVPDGKPTIPFMYSLVARKPG